MRSKRDKPFAVIGFVGSASAADLTHQFDIPAEPLGRALTDFSQTSSQQIIMAEAVTHGRMTSGLHGRYTAVQAIDALLGGTNLKAETNPAGVLMIRPKYTRVAANDGASDQPASAAPPSNQTTSVETVIITGTRVSGMTAEDSAAPITVLGADALSHTGQPNLINALAQQVPSFNAEGFGGDLAEYTLSARLRGLNPNDTLVLVNGKRRHVTGDFHVLAGPYQGSDTVDLSLIPLASVDHVEVLQDGAAAQYGTDAIAGVVNIILKKNASGGGISLTSGQYYEGDGDTYDVSVNMGLPLTDHGFLNLTYDKKFHGHSHQGGGDFRMVNADGSLVPNVYDATKIPGFPRVNLIVGDALYTLSTYSYNAGYDISDNVHLYSFGTYGTRNAKGYENIRTPDKIVASPVLGVPGAYNDPTSIIFSTVGFSPLENIRETDYSLTGGIKGKLAGWRWDASGTYGKDHNLVNTLHSANASLFIDTHFTPTSFHDGGFVSTEWTANLDINRDFEVGLYSPLTVAFGGELRRDSYKIEQGDSASTYKEGGQSYPGYRPSDAGNHTRENYAAYIDFAAFPIENLQLDIAGRFEHYTDFGDTHIGKVTARYDFNPKFAVRGTVSTGFRAPTLAEEFYSATNVSPISAFVQLPPNSAAARDIGVQPLQPETSTNYSAGIVTHPFENLHASLDAFSISLRNRVVGTGNLVGNASNPNDPILQAIKDHGNILDPTVGSVGVDVFVNGISTRTRGVDLTVNYDTDFNEYGTAVWTLAANYTETTITHIASPPAQLASQGGLFTPNSLSVLKNAAPKEKIGLGVLWNIDRWTVNLHDTIYGPTSEVSSTALGAPSFNEVGTASITDMEISYAFTDYLTFTVGGNNIFDKKPETTGIDPVTGLPNNVGDPFPSISYNDPNVWSPYGINGGYYYGRINITF